MAAKRRFPKQLIVRRDGDEDDHYFVAFTSLEDAMDDEEIGKTRELATYVLEKAEGFRTLVGRAE